MAGAGGDEPNLELPSFFGRRRKRQREEPSGPDAAAAPAEAPSAGPVDPAPTDPTPTDPAPTSGGLRPAAGAKRVPPPRRAPAPPSPSPSPEPTQPVARPRPTPAPPEPVRPVADPVEEPVAQPAARTVAEPPAQPVERPAEPVAQPVAQPVVQPVAEPVAAPETTPAPRRRPRPAARTVPPPPPRTRGPEMAYPEQPAETPTSVLTATRPEDDVERGDGGDAADGEGRRRRRPSVSLPHVSPWLAAALSGAVAALVGVALAWVALRGCDAVRGVSSCGGGPGLLLLLGVVVAEVAVGAALLRALGAVQPTGTSLVGVGLVVVLAMFFPAAAVTSVAAAVVLPVATALTFVVAHVAATTVVDLGD
ncbi:hypothetical protein ASG49_12945 [Marmoricola sp. Leaf446]|uniref:hypothetical protein n=1 Tax=Marmoricola sp. Leaf446 TaxID=1736379 RepID=UPI0006F35935|nr:hypothetical protein [Marmoricola sp. Leaf446]KQT90665.1 hypothetical protein ASG49_12945 [Marmoricola sp. Leaf446]